MSIMESPEEFYKNKLEDHSKITGEIISYSVRRLDVLIISVSGAGVYVCLEIMKFKKENNLDFNPYFLKFGGLVFALSIIINILGQWASYFSNVYSKSATDNKLKNKIYNEFGQDKGIQIQEKWAKIFLYLTKVSNVLSTTMLSVGIGMLVFFIWVTF